MRSRVQPQFQPSPFSPLSDHGRLTVHQGNSGGVETLPTISEDTVDYNERIISLDRILHGIDEPTTVTVS
ncbi:uncharacterized protein N7515_004115 [Penicillium bovifimosum]|uniref:Uncharacterized protein n=1 Tax=Penicillium bovifimosum TaxID=126998 RepID=A0A9W9H5X8_9EURO|nr:uncharacterized protein N7515_004115 [Penicillium bovifimosum]KAJ5139267.1 hypothetical protein N7515_004115 [Penicillium bovifimosum]